jgi:cobalamin biosynthesis protein CobT
MARRILNRKDMRADFDAAERRKEDEEQEEEEETDEDEEEESEDEEAEDEEAEDEEADEEGPGDEEEEEKPKKKKAKPKPPPAPKKTRTRAAKVVRQRVVWGVFNNSHQCVATYEYPRKAEAEQHAARLMQDKKSTHFIQPVKEPWEEREKKEKEK